MDDPATYARWQEAESPAEATEEVVRSRGRPGCLPGWPRRGVEQGRISRATRSTGFLDAGSPKGACLGVPGIDLVAGCRRRVKTDPLRRAKTDPPGRSVELSGVPWRLVVSSDERGGERVVGVEQWAWLRREHFVAGMSIKLLVRETGLSEEHDPVGADERGTAAISTGRPAGGA